MEGNINAFHETNNEAMAAKPVLGGSETGHAVVRTLLISKSQRGDDHVPRLNLTFPFAQWNSERTAIRGENKNT